MMHPLSRSLCLFLSLSGALAVGAPLDVSLPQGYEVVEAAKAPLVQHPIMATLGEPGKLFVGDSAGLNLNKAELEKQLPNRVLLLQDTNGNGVYDKVTVFADKMTFPQGGVWLDGSLYVASPPGIWKLTDTKGDGVADKRELIVSGFDYTGNAADVHGPFLHPNGRLYWCHGRKGHEVRQKDGTLVHAGLASGIWSSRPDGSDVQWHALACGDNPVEIDFTPEGEIVGTMNLFYSNPRGDVIVHWLHDGIYPREDQLKAVEGLPRTLDVMPVAYNFGHVAVSGCTFYRSGALNPSWRGNLFVTHFNTQRVTRMELSPDGATYKVAENEFFKLNQADAHLTDVLEDRDGSLLVVDTGGWFRIGCPSSLMAKPDIAGAIYRIRKTGAPAKVTPWGAATSEVWALARKGDAMSARRLAELTADPNAKVAHAAANALAALGQPETVPALTAALLRDDPGVQLAAANALGVMPELSAAAAEALLRRLDGVVDPSVEHQAMDALHHANQPTLLLQALRSRGKPALQRRALVVLDQLTSSPLAAADVLPLLDASDVGLVDALDAGLAGAAADVVVKHHAWMEAAAAHLAGWLKGDKISPNRCALVERIASAGAGEATMHVLVSNLLESGAIERQRTAWRILASPGSASFDPKWTEPLVHALNNGAPADTALVLDALARLRAPALVDALTKYSTDEHHPLAFRLKALRASLKPGGHLSAESFAFLLHVLADPASASARLEAARILGSSGLSKEQLLQYAGALGPLSPLELREAIRPFRGASNPAIAQAFATALKDAAAFGSFQESEVRTTFASLPPEAFAIIEPALRQLVAEDEARRRKLVSLPAVIAAKGRPAEGRKLFESGKGACVGCHRIGQVGNFVGPNLSTIGQIRTERDILESVLYPSATLARGYEAQVIEMSDGQSLTAVVHRSLPDALVVADVSGQERTIPRSQITSMQALPTSLMPMGLDRTISEDELIDLVAFLRSRK